MWTLARDCSTGRRKLTAALVAGVLAAGPVCGCVWHIYSAEVPTHLTSDSAIPELAIRDGDHDRYPRESFGVSCGTGDFWVDTFAQTISNGEQTAKLVLTDAELDTIYRQAIVIRLFEMREPYGGEPAPRRQGSPSDLWLSARAGGHRVDMLTVPPLPWTYVSPDQRRVRDLISLVLRIVASHPEYKALQQGAKQRWM